MLDGSDKDTHVLKMSQIADQGNVVFGFADWLAGTIIPQNQRTALWVTIEKKQPLVASLNVSVKTGLIGNGGNVASNAQEEFVPGLIKKHFSGDLFPRKTYESREYTCVSLPCTPPFHTP